MPLPMWHPATQCWHQASTLRNCPASFPVPAHPRPRPHPTLWLVVYWTTPQGPEQDPEDARYAPPLSAPDWPTFLPSLSTPFPAITGGLSSLRGPLPRAPTSWLQTPDTRRGTIQGPSHHAARAVSETPAAPDLAMGPATWHPTPALLQPERTCLSTSTHLSSSCGPCLTCRQAPVGLCQPAAGQSRPQAGRVTSPYTPAPRPSRS